MKYLSLFTGIGGFELGIERAYVRNSQHAPFSEESESEERAQGRLGTTDKHGTLLHAGNGTAPLCVGYSEIDKYATQIYERHYPDHHNWGDITKLNPDDLPDFDFLCGGFPCQAFSIAGKRKGFEDTRGTLFFDIARILRAKQPRLFLLENVKGLLSHDNGETFRTIISTLDELGYDLQWQVLNSKNFGVPQNRERVFIVGHLRGTRRPEVFPFGESNGTRIRELNQPSHSFHRLFDVAGIAPTVRGASGGTKPINIRVTEDGFHEYRDDPKKSSIQGTHVTFVEGKTGALNTAHKPMTLEGAQIRRLTPTECERLQGFPDGWTEGVSDTQRYKCLGNAVTVNVIEAIVSKMV